MLYPHLNGKRVILASQSPRRLELVKGLELEPVTWLKDVDESFPHEITGPAIAEYVTRLKAEAYWDELGADDVLITGDTGIGKTWLACALAHQACREGFSALYIRLPRLLSELAIARGDGRYAKLLARHDKLLISLKKACRRAESE